MHHLFMWELKGWNALAGMNGDKSTAPKQTAMQQSFGSFE